MGSAASSLSLSVLMRSTCMGVRMSGMLLTRQLSMAKLITLSVNVRRDIWTGQHAVHILDI